MGKNETIEVLEALANGFDPVTGEVLVPGGNLQHPKVIRALFNAVALLKEIPVKGNASFPANKGVAWSKEEDERPINSFKSNFSTGQLAKEHLRSRTAIEGIINF